MSVLDPERLRRIIIHDCLDPVVGSSAESVNPYVPARQVPARVPVAVRWPRIAHWGQGHSPVADQVSDPGNHVFHHTGVQELTNADVIWSILCAHGEAPFTTKP